MKGTSLRISLLGFFAIAMVFSGAVSCGGDDNGPNPTPTPDPVATAPGDYFVTDFIVTNTSNSQDVVDGDSFGLSFYLILNEGGSVSGAAQTPQNPPQSISFSGSWELGDDQVGLTITDSEGVTRILQGSLDFDGDGDVVFSGSQVGGAPLEIGNGGATYTITTFKMTKYSANITNQDFVGTWNAVSGTSFKNEDSSVKVDALAGGADVTVTFNADGSAVILNTLPGGSQDNFTTNYVILDNFHFTIEVDDETQTLVYSLIDDVLTLYIYDQNATFPPDSSSSSATTVYNLERI